MAAPRRRDRGRGGGGSGPSPERLVAGDRQRGARAPDPGPPAPFCRGRQKAEGPLRGPLRRGQERRRKRGCWEPRRKAGPSPPAGSGARTADAPQLAGGRDKRPFSRLRGPLSRVPLTAPPAAPRGAALPAAGRARGPPGCGAEPPGPGCVPVPLRFGVGR